MTTYALVTNDVQAGAELARLPGAVDPARIREQLADIVNQLGQLVSNPLGLPLQSLEVDLTITAEGSVGFLGTGGKLTGEGSIKLVFARTPVELAGLGR